MNEMVERLLGTCPICEGTYKLHVGMMVHHGYRRPGDGFIHGDCYAVGHPPYEVSCEITKVYRGQIERQRANVQKTLDSYKAGEVTRFTNTDLKRVGFGRSELVTTEFVLGVTEPYTWRHAYESRVKELENNIRMMGSEIDRVTRLIDNWQPRDIQKVMEEKARLDKEARDAKEAEKQAKKTEKARKEAEKQARREAREAKREAVRKQWADTFEALAKEPKTAERENESWRLIEKFKKIHMYWWDLKCDEALIELGIGYREGNRTYYRR